MKQLNTAQGAWDACHLSSACQVAHRAARDACGCGDLVEDQDKRFLLILSLPGSVMETCSVVLTFESVDEILWCDHSNETSLAVLLYGTICFSIFKKIKFGIFFEF